MRVFRKIVRSFTFGCFLLLLWLFALFIVVKSAMSLTPTQNWKFRLEFLGLCKIFLEEDVCDAQLFGSLFWLIYLQGDSHVLLHFLLLFPFIKPIKILRYLCFYHFQKYCSWLNLECKKTIKLICWAKSKIQ